jgi:hypothetical protein
MGTKTENNHYAAMSKKQICFQQRAEGAKLIRDKADCLRCEYKDGIIRLDDGSNRHSTSSSDDERNKKVTSGLWCSPYCTIVEIVL